MTKLPLLVNHVGVPPIKCQGIKTKLVPFILRNIEWVADGTARWIEPFLGSGVVAFNLAPEHAILADTNEHIIGFYQDIYRGEISQTTVRRFLEQEGRKLQTYGADYYYEVRERFNDKGSSLDFLFLNRSCFNGLMRFNRQGKFNVPFGHKPNRFSKAYITKIVNQVGWIARRMRGRRWQFRVAPWHQILDVAQPEDFVYIDPPYIGRHTDYHVSWDKAEAEKLSMMTGSLACGYAVSMWLQNRYRKNEHIERCWSESEMRIVRHFYHVGSRENLRNEMYEALLIKPGFATPDGTGGSASPPSSRSKTGQGYPEQMVLF